MRKSFAAVALVISLAISGMPTSSADTLIFATNSNEDRKQPVDMNYRYEPMSMSVNVMDSNKGEIIIKANFSSALSPTSFMNYSGAQPLLRIKILNTLTTYKGDNGYIWLEAPNNQAYQGSTRIDAISSIYSDPKIGPSAGRKSLAYCNPKTWMDSGASSNWVAFSIDRNCADINDMFWVIGYMDSDIWNSTYMYDSKYFPAEPFLVNMGNVPRPPKMREQKLSFVGSIGNQSMENPRASTTVVSNEAGVPLTVISFTETICKILSQNGGQVTVQLVASGTCTLDAFSPGNSLVKPSAHIQQSFYIAPIVMQNQEIYWDEPYDVMVGDQDFDLYIYTSAKLPVTVTSQSPSVCQFRDVSNPSMVTIIGAGYCQLTVSQAGNERYYSRTATASFYVEKAPVVDATTKPKPPVDRSKSSAEQKAPPKKFSASTSSDKQQDIEVKKDTAALSKKGAKETTIKCSKGLIVKTVKAVNPKCPSGWKLKK